MALLEEESLSVQSDTESIKEVKKEQFDKELTVLSSQFNEIEEENKEMSNKLSKMKVDYLRSLSSNPDSAASKVRRGMSLEIDDCKCCLEAMTRPDYQPLVDNKRIIEKLQEKITLMNMELITAKKHNKKIMKEIEDFDDDESEVEDDDSEVEEIEYDSLSDEEDQMCTFLLYCNHPVTGQLTSKSFQVHKDELLPTVLDTAYELMELAPHIPIERCCLVKYNFIKDVMEQSFDLDKFQDQTIGKLMGVAGYCGLFLETCRDIETFKKYNIGGINLEISVVDLSTGEVGPAKPMRGDGGWTVGELKQHIGESFNLISSSMRLLILDRTPSACDVIHLEDVKSSLKEVLFKEDVFSSHKLHREQLVVPTIYMYVSSDPIDYRKEYKDSLMYRYVDFDLNSIILLDITLPHSQPEATLSTANVTEGRIIMKIISMNEENKRKMQVQVDKRITLAELKEELVPLIGVPPTGFRMYRISEYGEYEMTGLDKALINILSGSKITVRLGRALGKGEYIFKLYLLQLNNTYFCKYMMESIYAKGTPVREFKKQIIEEAKVQGIDCVLELDKMRLRKKSEVYPGRVYLDHQTIDTIKETYYVEPLKGPEKMKHHTQRQVYVIRWHPSHFYVDPIEEIILDKDNNDPKHVIEKLSELSGVPAEYIYFAKSESFPVEMSCLNIENKLKWYSITSDTYSKLYSDGRVIYYKDNRETMKKLTYKERSEIQEAEEARLQKIREYKYQYGTYCLD
ncbi:PREDICTED: ubiquitin carboxyl-terminal hydrolase 47-like [Amphimedon queenslandica]|uniref:Ubiquitin carboxyl-terminal hydrolase 47 C-terminal domain-containing protein n=1 Tax=Amphimedon queenslandica TaxID=400682 RepID=A0AAN0JL74_AMPQE|nr:PREDICTED: ubiquitin carboxyl-terminal hydrolase 47-like [Amphimedon queenslandica]|eukprot:XP_019857767.1 PREDICTED: ubiquitin carboxyl-terminal hydrolase 47-like [Amphimedon queenslandica]